MGRSRVSEADPLGKAKRGRPPNKTKETLIKTGFDGHSNAPWRKTVSIFKQPVTLVHTTSRDSKKPTPEQLKRGMKGSQEKPFQLLWARSLDGIQASVPLLTADKLANNEPLHLTESLSLAGRLEKITDLLSEKAAAASLCSAIQNPSSVTISGQKAERKDIENNIFTALDPEQPMIAPTTVTVDDITAQEKRVLDARKRLQEVRKHFG